MGPLTTPLLSSLSLPLTWYIKLLVLLLLLVPLAVLLLPVLRPATLSVKWRPSVAAQYYFSNSDTNYKIECAGETN